MPRDPAFSIHSDTLEARILPRGATLTDLRFAGAPESLILGFRDTQNHQRIPVYAGAIVGPVANRIGAGQITLDGVTHQMPLNENGTTCLHSGNAGLHMLDWSVMAHKPDSILLGCTLAHGDHGLPGQRSITAAYRLAGDTLTVTLTALSDQTTAINLAAHPYWKLDTRDDLSGHRLQIHADQITPTDAHALPIGQTAKVVGTRFDFTQPTAIPLHPALDVNYCLATQMNTAPRPCATLTGASGITLSIATTAPGLQVYNGAFLPTARGVLHGGKDLVPYAGIALEPQFWPNAPHHGDFPPITLAPDTLWQQITTYRLTKADPLKI